MIVTMAIVTTMAMPPSLRWALNRLPLSDEEKERLENDEADAKGFVPNLERDLIEVDDSSNVSSPPIWAVCLLVHDIWQLRCCLSAKWQERQTSTTANRMHRLSVS